MSNYVLSILGIVLLGIIIDVILPFGSINKYIKSIYSIFIVAVIISPVVQLIAKKNDFKLSYTDYEVDKELVEYILTNRVKNDELKLENYLSDQGLSGIDIVFEFSINNNEIEYNSCSIYLQNLVISQDKQHINKYEYIKDVVAEYANLTEEEIVLYE